MIDEELKSKGAIPDLNHSILEIWKLLAGDESIGVLLQAVVKTSEVITQARSGKIILFADSWQKFEYQFATIEELSLLKNLQAGTGAQILGIITRDGVSLELENLEAKIPDSKGVSMVSPDKSRLEEPFKLEGKIIGTLHLQDKPGGFTPNDQTFLQTFLEQVAVSIERAILRTRLNKTQNRLEGIFEAIGDGILVLNSEGRPVMANHALQRLLFPDEIPSNSALSSILPSLYNPDQDEGIQEIVLLKPHAKVISSHFVNIRDALGNVNEVILSLRNITSGREEERKFLQLSAMISRRVARWMKVLNSSHPKKRRAFFKTRRLVENLFRLTEIKSGPLRIQRLPVELLEILQENLKRFSRKFQKRGLNLVVNIHPDAENLSLSADEEFLKDALSILFMVHLRNLQPHSQVEFSQTLAEKGCVLTWRTSIKAWKELPGPASLDWNSSVESFIAAESRPFILDLPFARHILEAHKGGISLTIERDSAIFEAFIPSET